MTTVSEVFLLPLCIQVIFITTEQLCMNFDLMTESTNVHCTVHGLCCSVHVDLPSYNVRDHFSHSIRD